MAMDVSCHSLVSMARLAEPLMTDDGSPMTMSYLGASEVVPNYGLMGPFKAALQSTLRYLAAELWPAGIRVNAISPGPIETRAAYGPAGCGGFVNYSARRAPLRTPLDIDEVGPLCAFFASDAVCVITGGTLYVDDGYHLLN